MEQKLLLKYIQGKTTPEELELVIKWLDEDEKNMREFMSLQKVYNASLWIEEETGKEENTTKKKMNLRHRFFEIGKIAAIFLIAFKLGSYYISNDKTDDIIWQTLHVPAGQRAELTLTDGSRVWLNAMSTLTFPNKFTGKEREVTMDGEGYFEVESDPEQPFVIATNNYHVKAHGTTLNVLAYSQSSLFEASLIEGKIEIIRPGETKGIFLQPDMTAYLENNQLKIKSIRDPDYFHWTNGLLCFDDEPINSLFHKLELYYDTSIEVNNLEMRDKNYTYTGKFRIKDGIEHVLRVLQINRYFRYEKDEEANKIIIS